MATQNPFLQIRNQAGDTKKSVQWYQTQVKALAAKARTPESLMRGNKTLTTTISPGNLYMFFYDAKFKDVLPFWDKFPLVLPFSRMSDGFLGINLHYVPYVIRFNLLGALSEFASNEKMDDTTKIVASWRLLNSSSKLAPIKACVKHYLFDHVQSKFLKVAYPDWVTASQLPVEQFVGANKSTVWKESRKKY